MRHLPNMISGFRIVLIPVFVWLMMRDEFFGAALVLLFSAVTDVLDGYLARRNGWITQLGKVLDPAADKLTQVTVCVVLAVKIRFLLPLLLIMLCKEFLMLVLGAVLVVRGIKLEGAKWFGKLSTVLFYLIMTAILFFPKLPQVGIYWMVALATASALGAVLMYIPEYRRYLLQSKNTHPVS